MKKEFLFFILILFYFSSFPQTGGPWDHKVYRATSTDGVNWTRDTNLLFYPASVPGAVMDTNQTVFLYYVKMNNASDTEKLMVATSFDGEYFMSPQLVNISGSTVIRRVDPDPVMLPDGRIRLYYINFDMMPPQEVHSAVSNDGINFTEEPGIRFADSTGITDPDVFYSGSFWNMYVSKGVQLLRSFSSDGLTFTADTAFHWDKGAVSNSIMISCGLCRTYFCNNGIRSATGPDGSSLYIESGVRLTPYANEFICDPSVIHYFTGEYMIYFKSYTNTSLGEYEGCSCATQLQNYPNPFDDQTMITVPENIFSDKKFTVMKIFDFSGKEVRSEEITGAENVLFSRNGLQQGIYFYLIQTESGISGKGKFIIE
jgi:hypothetical protein